MNPAEIVLRPILAQASTAVGSTASKISRTDISNRSAFTPTDPAHFFNMLCALNHKPTAKAVVGNINKITTGRGGLRSGAFARTKPMNEVAAKRKFFLLAAVGAGDYLYSHALHPPEMKVWEGPSGRNRRPAGRYILQQYAQ